MQSLTEKHVHCWNILPSEGTEVAVGGAASTKIRSNSKKLAKMLIAESKI